MRSILKNRVGATDKAVIAILVVLMLMVGGFGGYWAWNNQKQATALKEANAPGAIPDTLTGKAATYSIKFNDFAADNPQTSQVAVPGYVIKDPVFDTETNPTKISGSFVYDGTASSSTVYSDVVTGINVGDKVLGIGFNNTWYGVPGPVEILADQSEDEALKVYYTNDGDGLVSVKDKDDNTLGILGVGTNLTLGSGQSEALKYIRYEQNKTNRAFYMAGFVVDVNVSSNLSALEASGNNINSNGDAIGGTYGVTTTGLQRIQYDDYIVRLSYPVMLKEFDTIEFRGVKWTADGDGCNGAATDGEDWVLHFFDANWFRSAQDSSVKLGAENDAVTPADVGAIDKTVAYTCTN